MIGVLSPCRWIKISLCNSRSAGVKIGGDGVLYKHEVCVGEETERGMKNLRRAIEETDVELGKRLFILRYSRRAKFKIQHTRSSFLSDRR